MKTFTPKLKAYIRDKEQAQINLVSLVKITMMILFLIICYRGVISIIRNNIDIISYISNLGFTGFITFTLLAQAKENQQKEVDTVNKMQSGDFKFNEVTNWKNMNTSAQVARLAIAFKANQAFSKNAIVSTKVLAEENTVVVSVQPNEILTQTDIIQTIENSFGTKPLKLRSHQDSPQMYEIDVKLSDIQWIEGQDIIAYQETDLTETN